MNVNERHSHRLACLAAASFDKNPRWKAAVAGKKPTLAYQQNLQKNMAYYLPPV